MARGINKVILIGNLGVDPETRFTQGGSPVTNFRIATSETWRDKQSNENVERTEWHSVVCFGRLAEIAGEYLKKGSKVYIEGSLRTSSWESDGQKRYKTEVIASEMQMLDGRGGMAGGGGGGQQRAVGAEDSYDQSSSGGGGGNRRSPQGGGRPAEPVTNPDTLNDFDDDIPF